MTWNVTYWLFMQKLWNYKSTSAPHGTSGGTIHMFNIVIKLLWNEMKLGDKKSEYYTLIIM